MQSQNSKFWIGMGIGSVVGVFIYRFSKSSKAENLKDKLNDTMQKVKGRAEDFAETVKEKAIEVGTKGADKISEKSHEIADRTDRIKNKVHVFGETAKR